MVSCILILMLITTANLFAMPPHPDVIMEATRSGTLSELTARLEGMRAAGIGMGVRSFPTTGTQKVLILIIPFLDTALTTPSPENFYKELFENGTGLTWKKYYEDMSNGQLHLTFDIHVCSAAANNLIYYGQNTSIDDSDRYPATLVGEAIDKAYSDGVDFSEYDNNGDGYCDVVVVIHAGQGEEVDGSSLQNCIWSHCYNLDSAKNIYDDGSGHRTYNDVIINYYTIQPEYILTVEDSTVGVFAHEFGHVLGLMDLYDVNENSKTDGVGKWSLMAGGSWNGPSNKGAVPAPFLAWEREILDWVTVDDESKYIVQSETPGDYTSFILLSVLFLGCGSTFFLIRRKQNLHPFVLFLLFVCFVPGILVTLNTCDPVITEPTEVTIKDIETSHRAVKISSGYNGSYPSIVGEQYYLCENRVKTAGTWSEYLPGEGLLITLIDDYVIYNIQLDKAGTYNLNNINSLYYTKTGSPFCHGVTIMEADGDNALWTISDYDSGSSTDPFYAGNVSSAKLLRNQYTNEEYYGTPLNTLSDVSLSDISAPGSTMTFKFTN